MMDHYQWELVCQAKQEVLSVMQIIQSLSVQHAQRGLPIPVIPEYLLEKLRSIQNTLFLHEIRIEHFNLSEFAVECLKNSDEQLVNYLRSCAQFGVF